MDKDVKTPIGNGFWRTFKRPKNAKTGWYICRACGTAAIKRVSKCCKNYLNTMEYGPSIEIVRIICRAGKVEFEQTTRTETTRVIRSNKCRTPK